MMYYSGLGVLQDDVAAMAWLLKAVEQGNPDAEHFLGTLYKEGWGVAQDNTKAAKWYRKAAKQGHEEAQQALTKLGLD